MGEHPVKVLTIADEVLLECRGEHLKAMLDSLTKGAPAELLFYAQFAQLPPPAAQPVTIQAYCDLQVRGGVYLTGLPVAALLDLTSTPIPEIVAGVDWLQDDLGPYPAALSASPEWAAMWQPDHLPQLSKALGMDLELCRRLSEMEPASRLIAAREAIENHAQLWGEILARATRGVALL